MTQRARRRVAIRGRLGVLVAVIVALVLTAGCSNEPDDVGGATAPQTSAGEPPASPTTDTSDPAPEPPVPPPEPAPTTAPETGELPATPAPASVPAPEPPPDPAPGGVVRIGWEGEFDFSDGLDPTGEYLGEGIGILSNLLVRTLVGYRHLPGGTGDELVPDLATDLGEVTDDGLTVTFRLRDGAQFGPPLSRPITSDDVRFAFERIGTPALGAQYAFYYEVIEGMSEFMAGDADTIGGIETPDTNTIVFRLTEPVGDFAYRLSMPAAAAMPPEVAGCFDEPSLYGRVLVASGPYMIAGSDEQDVSSCETLEPLAGFDPTSQLALVRNPDWDPDTDPEGNRPALPDGFVFTVVDDAAEIARQLEAGTLDGEVSGPPDDVLERYAADPDLLDRLHVNPSDDVLYLALNVGRPPFDDVNVRKAVNYALDRRAVISALGGALVASPLTHVFPDALLGDRLTGYAPYGPASSVGDPAAAATAMRISRYDVDGDGRCDDPVCNGVVLLTGEGKDARALAGVVTDALSQLGIEPVVESRPDIAEIAGSAPDDVALTLAPGWSKDYADPSTIAVLLRSESIGPPSSLNASLVGLTVEQVDSLGISGVTLPVPSVDPDIAACSVVADGAARLDCWSALDQRLMEEIVPWAPLASTAAVDIVGPAVTAYEYDQSSGGPAWVRWAIDPALQR